MRLDGCGRTRPGDGAVRACSCPWSGFRVAATPGCAASVDARRFRLLRRARPGRQELRVHHGWAAGGRRPSALEASPVTRGPRGICGRRPAVRDGDVDEREGELPRLDPTLAVREEADTAGTVAVQRRAIALPDRISVHEVGRLVPARQGHQAARHERAHAGRPRIPAGTPAAGLLVRSGRPGFRGRLRDRRPPRIWRAGARASIHREPALDRARHPHPGRDTSATRRSG